MLLAFLLVYAMSGLGGYQAEWDRIPPQHQAYVKSIKVWNYQTGYGIAHPDGTIELPKWTNSARGTLAHEVGHIAGWRNPNLLAEYRRLFVDKTGRGIDEDFADTYMDFVLYGRTSDAARNMWMTTFFDVTVRGHAITCIDGLRKTGEWVDQSTGLRIEDWTTC